MSANAKNEPLISMEALEHASECLRTLAHPARLRMVQMMLQGEHTVGELAEACGIQPHMASEHLRLMKHCGLLASERDGRKIYYTVAEAHLERIMECIQDRFGS